MGEMRKGSEDRESLPTEHFIQRRRSHQIMLRTSELGDLTEKASESSKDCRIQLLCHLTLRVLESGLQHQSHVMLLIRIRVL